jgi:DNA polymerase III epsilon subunit family exonuclease
MAFEQCARPLESLDDFFRLQEGFSFYFIPGRKQATMPCMMIVAPRNLVSDSPLVQEAIDLLRVCGGRAPAADIADIVLKLPDLEAELAALLVSDLIRDDHRLRLAVDAMVELNCEDVESRVLHESDFVVVDVETTGAKTPPGRITEIGAYRVSRGRIVAEFQTLVNPETQIPPFIVQLTGITNQMVRDAPIFAEVIEGWLGFASDAVLVAHNAQFDVRFLNHEIRRVFPGRRMINSHLCTVKLSRRIFPGLTNYRLHTIAEHFTIPILNRHRAPDDALATAEIFIHILARLRQHNVHDVAGARLFQFLAASEPC